MDAYDRLADAKAGRSGPAEPNPALAKHLAAEGWVKREFKPPVKLLGEVLTSNGRMFIVGGTGIGKTMFGLGLAGGMATGAGFLNWKCDRPVRVLYIDGEMPGELIQSRLADAMRRLDRTDLGGRLFVYAADAAETCAKLYPAIGTLEPLNTEAGQMFVQGLIEALGGVDVVIFDNVMSLVAGDQKDEVPWSETLPLVSSLTRQNIGQIWLDHTGHNTARQYGSSTKAWRFDAVGILTELPEEERTSQETAFKLSFDAPGKARRRTPDNWRDFAPQVIRLAGDRWTTDAAASTGTASMAGKAKVSPSRAVFHSALIDALIVASSRPGTTTLAAWEAECVRRGLIDAAPAGEDGKGRHTRLTKFRTARVELVARGWVGIDGQAASDLTRKYPQHGAQ